MTKAEEDYILKHYGSFMTLFEHAANRNFFFDMKLASNENPSHAYKRSLESKKINKSEVLQLMEGGYERFRRNVAHRILKEHEAEIVFNKCPACNKLVRTPRAKQCQHCFHRWHSTNQSS